MRYGEPHNKIRVLIVDDSLYMRRMLRRMLESHPGITVIDEAKDGVEAVAKCISLNPDVMVLDIEMPKMDGLSVLGTHDETAPARGNVFVPDPAGLQDHHGSSVHGCR